MTDKLLKQTRKFLLSKIIPRAGFNLATGRMFDTPGLAKMAKFIYKNTCPLVASYQAQTI